MVNVNIIGRLGADAELIKGENGTFLSFRMAVDDGKNKNGDKLTSWFRVTLNGDRATKLAEYLTKGKLVNVIGTEKVGIYNAKDGTQQVSRDISANNVEFISVGSGSTTSDTTTTEITTGKFVEKPLVKTTTAASSAKEPEDDLPF
jgi:single-strand DNA-binding protein